MTSAPIRVFGIGSPFGDDRLGWRVAGMVQETLQGLIAQAEVEVSVVDRPGAVLVAMLDGARGAILLDAVRSGAAPGTLHRMAAAQLDRLPSPLSSHDLGVVSALQLARVLGVLPARTAVLGIELDPEHQGADLSAAVSASLTRAADEACRLVHRWQKAAHS